METLLCKPEKVPHGRLPRQAVHFNPPLGGAFCPPPDSETQGRLPSARVIRVLNQLVEMKGKPKVITVDNGPEFISIAMDRWAYQNGIANIAREVTVLFHSQCYTGAKDVDRLRFACVRQ